MEALAGMRLSMSTKPQQTVEMNASYFNDGLWTYNTKKIWFLTGNLRIKNNNQKGCNQIIYFTHEKERDIETKKECEEAAKFLEIRARAWGLVSSNQQKIWKYQTTSGPTAIVARSNNNPSSCFYKIDEYQKATLYFNANGLGTRQHWRGKCTINEPCICKKSWYGNK